MDAKKVAIIGHGYVGKAFNKMFPEAVIYDEPQKVGNREDVNSCDLAIICVPTDLLIDNTLDMSIVEDVISWVKTPLILIKSALMPGTVDRLKEKYNKRITVSPEYIGEGKYFIPEWKYPNPTNPISHNFVVIGGDKKDTSEVADILWEKMSPDTFIHQVSAIEAELTKLLENSWGAMKVSFMNELFDLCKAWGADFKQVLMGWGLDGRVELMHTRVLPYKRGWKSKCWNKDIPAFIKSGDIKGVDCSVMKSVLKSNKKIINVR